MKLNHGHRGLINFCAALPSEAHAAQVLLWANNSATCCSRRRPLQSHGLVMRGDHEERTHRAARSGEAGLSPDLLTIGGMAEIDMQRRYFVPTLGNAQGEFRGLAGAVLTRTT